MRSFTQKLMMFFVALLCSVSLSVSAQTLNEGFENTSFPPADWSTIQVSGSVNWIRSTAAKHAGSASAYVNYATSGHENYLVTPKLTPAADESLSFYVASENYAGTTLTVEVSTTDATAAAFTTVLATYTTGSSGTIGTTSTSSWVEKTIDLTDYVGQNIYIAFHVVDDNGSAIYVDDVTGVTLFVPSCPAPTISEELTLTSEGATITWTAGGSETSWQYVCLAAGADLSWDDAITTTTPSVILTGKTANTAYDFYVRAYCGQDDQSAERKVSFRTACGIEAIPYTNGFEEETSSAVPSCWTRPDGQSYPYVSGSSYSAYEGSKSLYFYGGGSTSEQFIVLPQMANAINTLAIQFYYKASVTGWSTYGVPQIGYVTNRDDMTTFVALDTLDQQSDYTLYELNLDAAPANAAYIAIRYGDGSSSGSFYLDNLTIKAIPNCKKPTTLNISDITTTGAAFTWTAGGSETNFEYIVLPAGAEEVWNNPTAVNNQNSVTLTTLTANTAYDFYVRAACGDTEKSDARMVSFRTACGIAAIPYTNGFEDETANALPSCWEKVGSGTVAVQTTQPHNGTKSLKFSGTTSNIIAFPVLGAEINTLQVTLYTRPESTTNSSCGDFKVGYLTDVNDASTFIAIATWSYDEFSDYAEKVVNLSSAPDGARLAFSHNPTSGSWYWFVDDVVVENLPSCIKPQDVAASEIAHDQAKISWTSESEAFNIQYGTDAEFAESTYIETTADTTTKTLTGLTAQTTYYVRVQTNCGSNSVSEWTNAISFTTTATATPVGDNWSDNFEGESCSWELINGTIANAWVCGTAVNNGGTHSLYVSNDGGTTHAYTNNVETMVYAAKLLNFADGKYQFSYDWLANGESTYDYLRVALVPASVTLTAGSSIVSGMTATALPSGWIALDGGNKLNLVTTWQNKVVAINVTAGNYYLVLAWRDDTSGGTNPPAAVDNMSITRMACPFDVLNLAASNIQTTAATLTWVGGEATQWQVAYSLNSTFEDATEDLVSDSTYDMANLTAATQYYVRVRAYCGGTDFGAWSEVISFPTVCEAVTEFPWSENFDDYELASAYTPSAQVLPICWEGINTTTYSSYKVYPTIYYYSSTDYSHSQNNSLRFYSYYSSYGSYDPQPQYAILPEMTNLDSKRIIFWARGYNANSTIKVGRMTDATDASTFVQIGEELALTTTYQKFTINLAGENATGNYIAIMIDAATSSRSYNGAYVDDITVEDLPSCLELASLTYENVTARTATLKWIQEGGAEDFQYVVALRDSLPDWENGVVVTDSMVVVTSLSPLTAYDIYVRAYCSETSQSVASKVSFTTEPSCYPLASVTTIPARTKIQLMLNPMAGHELAAAYELAYADSALTAELLEAADKTVVTDSVYTITGLDRETTYYIYVRANCGDEDGVSAWDSTTATTKGLNYIAEFIAADGTSTSSSLPINSSWTDTEGTHMQMIYPADMLTGLSGITINSLHYYANGTNSSWTNAVFEVRMMQTETATMGSDFVATTSATLVYTGTVTVNPTDGMLITLATPFTYTEGNLLIDFLVTTPDSYNSVYFYGITTTEYQSRSRTSNSKFLPKVGFGYPVALDPCPAVTDLKVELVGDGTSEARISWTTADADYLSSYDLYLSETEVDDLTGITPTVTGVDAAATSYLFSNLTAEASYYFYIRANCQIQGHEEGMSDWVGVDTTMNANCAAPKELTTEFIGLNAVKASWEKAYPEQDVLEFRYILSTEELDAAGLAAETPENADTNAIELNDLDYNQTYYLYVATACSATSTSDYIHTSFTTFAECAPVENLTVARFEHNRVVLTWTKNEFGTETEYEVGIVGDETNAQRVAGLTTMLIGLEPETDYTAYVKALCGEESASVITTVPFTTASMPGACVTIGSGTTTTSYGPIYSYYNRPAYTQQLYVLNDASAGTITSIALEHKGNSYNGDMTVTNYTIYMANTSATSLASGWITEGLTEVFTGTTTFPHGTNGNWVTIDLTTPFVWDGTSNIVVAVYTPTVYTLTAGTYDSYFYGTSASGAGRYYAESSGVTLEDNLVPSAAGTTFSTIANIQFCFEPKACPDVTAMTISDITPTTAVATWEPMGSETSWKIAYTTEVVDNPALLSTTVDEMRYEMNGLDVDQDYWFYVQPVCEGADSWRVATFRTIATCFPPTALRADSIKARTALVCWQDTINEAGNYTVAYGPAAEFDEGDFSTVNVMDDTCVLLTGLIPETNYKFKVCANCSPDTSSRYSTVATFRTDISCYAPTALVASSITSTSAVITWTDLHDAAAYRVYYGEAATFDLEDEDTYFTLDVETGTTATLNDLNSYTQYQVVVKSICGDEDESAYSTDLTFKTSATVPFVPVFTSTTPFPSDWKRYDGLFNTDTILTSALTTSSKWGLVSATTAINSIHFKANIYTSSWGGSTMGWVITPTIDLSTVAEGSELILSFDAALNKYSETTTDPDSNDTDDKFAVIISRDGGLTWTKTDMTLWQNVEGADYRYSDIPKTGHTYSIDMTQYAGMNIAIAFYGESTVSGDDNDLHFGNINLIQQVHYTDSVCQYLNFENHGFEEASSDSAGTFHFEGLKDQVYTIFDLTVNEGTDPASNFVDIESAYVGDHFDFPFLSFTVAAGDDGWYDNSEAGTTTVHGCNISFAAIIYEILTAEIFPTEYQTLAEGDTINWRGHKITVVGEYADTVRTEHGGAKEIYSLSVSAVIPMTIYSATVCQGDEEFDHHGFEEASSDSVGDFEYHSDSVIFLLTVNPISVEEYDRYLYPGDHYSDANFEEFVATIDTSYILVGTNVKGCDSIIIMHVIINTVDTIRETFEMPENDTIWHGITITEPGMYYYTEPSFLGGDSIRYILTVTAPVTPVEGRTFELVTEQLSDWSGNYLIVFSDNKAHATVSGSKKKDLVATSGELTITEDNKITTAENCFVTLTAMGTDDYSILLPNGMYLNEPSDNSVDESANAQAMTLTYNETKAGVEISGGNRILCHNSSGGNFYRMYTAVGSHALPRLFKEVSGEGPATAIETINTANEAVKVILNGNLYIIRDNQWYDATGRLTSDPRK